jgi:2-polyprenyl-6-methoxyphenol hydroxylase-like FAD-dependent oxidoreductase
LRLSSDDAYRKEGWIVIDVVVVGAGPNGLMLAGELALAGVRPVVLERLTGPAEEQRANGMVGQVVRMLDRRGLYARLTGSDTPPQPAPRFVFGAFPLHLAGLPDNPLYVLPVPQRQVEQALAERAAELGVEVRRGAEVVGLRQDADAVHVTLAGGETVTARWLVGADGGHSVVRKLAGIGFPGVTTDDSVSRSGHVSVPAAMVDPATAGLVIDGWGIVPPFQHTRTERGLIVWGPFPGRAPLLSSTERPSADDEPGPMTLAELRASASRVVGADVPVGPPEGDGPHLLRRLTGGNTRLADRYRAGRVLLIGDAAHVHPAMGGPGLNLGLQDAVNLGWKLAADVHGWAPDGLLDSYEAERRPVAERVTVSTRAQLVLAGPGGDITALRVIFGELLAKPENTRHIAALLAGADVRYDVGAPEPAGTWAPDLVLHTGAGQVRLAELTRQGRPLLLDFTGTLAETARPWQDRVDTVAAKAEGTALTAMLIRPDGYIAWVSVDQRPDQEGLRAGLTRWFGRPADALAAM